MNILVTSEEYYILLACWPNIKHLIRTFQMTKTISIYISVCMRNHLSGSVGPPPLSLSLSLFTKLCGLEMIQGYKYNQGYQWDLQTNLRFLGTTKVSVGSEGKHCIL